MEAVPVNEPATLILKNDQVEFDTLTEAIRHAIEEAEKANRHMVIVTKSGQKFDLLEIQKMHDEHLQGP